MQFFSLGLISEMITSHHEERAGERERAELHVDESPLVSDLRVLYFGTYERDYPRNAQVISCLRGAGVEVVERHVAGLGGTRATSSRPARRRALRLARAELRLLARAARAASTRSSSATRATSTCPPRRRAARGRPVVFNPLVSLADTLVADRGRFRAGLARGARARARSTGARFARPTSSSPTPRRTRDFLAELGGPRARRGLLRRRRGAALPPGWRPARAVHGLFVGKLIPLHGLETILAAARLAPELPLPRRRQRPARARCCATGRRTSSGCAGSTYERLPDELHGAGCALGIFGTSAKAQRVIPNKAFQALACGTPLVTADTPAARELLVDGESALLVPPGDPERARCGAAAARRRRRARAAARSAGGRAAYERARERGRARRALARADRGAAVTLRLREPLLWAAIAAYAAGFARALGAAPPRVRRPAASTSATWCRRSGRPRTATRCASRPARRADLAARRALRPDPRRVRAALVALAEP